MHIKKKLLIRIGISLAVVFIGYFLYKSFHRSGAPQLPPVVVNAEKTKAQKWYTQIKATGTLSSFRGIMISSEVSGRVTKISFESGTLVNKDSPLFQIYPDILQAQLEQYQAMAKLSALDYERGLKLYQTGTISRQSLDTLTSKLAQDQALVSQTKAQLGQHNILAPFTGQAGLRLVNEGDYVSPGQHLLSFQQLEPLRIQFSVPENFLPLLARKQTVQVIPSSNPDLVETGIVYAFDSAIDPSTRAIAIRAQVPNKHHQLIPGGFAEVTLFAGKQRDVVTINQTAINYSTLGTSVYVIQPDNTVKSIQVNIGDRMGNDIEILSGLEVGDMIVTAGQIKLYEGAKVTIAPVKTVLKTTSADNQQPAAGSHAASTSPSQE